MESDTILLLSAVSVGCFYVLSSFILLRFPWILHETKNISFKARHISHRGGAGEYMENTMAAFKNAVNVGTDMLELDCWLTKDGHVVVAHDNNLLRTCRVDMNISDTNYSDLPTLKHCPVQFESIYSYPKWCADVCNCEDMRIPLLKDIFTAFPNLPINIDIKQNNDELIEKVASLILEFNRIDLTAWGNMSDAIAKNLHKSYPNIPLIFSFRRILFLILFYYIGLLPFVPIKERFFEVITPLCILRLKIASTFSYKLKVFIRFCDIIGVRQKLIRHLQKRGIQVYLFVLNDEAEFKRAFELGVDGIMTDYPTLLNQYLHTHLPCQYQCCSRVTKNSIFLQS